MIMCGHGYLRLKGTKTTNTPPNRAMFTQFKGQNPKADMRWPDLPIWGEPNNGQSLK